MARDLRSKGANRHFVWPQLRQSVEERAQTDELFAPLSLSSAGWYTAEVDEPTPHGSPPTVHDIAKILRSARECKREMESEAGWNCAVHYPVLDLAVQTFDDKLRVTNSTAAAIRPEYAIAPTASGRPSKKVGLYITIRASTDDLIVDRIAILNNCGAPINHTSHDVFSENPIGLSIETKARRRRSDEEEAQLQIGTWLSAQFQCLQTLVRVAHDGDQS